MRGWHSSGVFVALIIAFHGAIITADDVEGGKSDTAGFAARMLAITDVVLEQHIDPPSRQEMILSGVKALYRADNRPVPKGLSARISQLAGGDELAACVRDELEQFDKLPGAEAVFTGGMFEMLPGGAHLMAADVNKIDKQIRENRYVGVGIALAIDRETKLPQMPKVFYNGPAWKAGVKAGDLIVEIDGQSTEGMQMKAVLAALRGEEGTDVSIVVRRSGEKEPLPIAMTRGRVFIPTVLGVREKSEGEWEYTLDTARDVALIRVTSIGPSTLAELRQLEARLHREEVQGVILDLRYGGAVLHDVVLLADALLDEGVIGRVRSLDKLETFEARPGSLFSGLPMAVLVGKLTASGQVFLTAALQDRGRATVIGEAPTGEIYVRSRVEIPGGENLVLATAELQRGDGTPLVGRRPARTGPEVVSLDERAERPTTRPASLLPDYVVADGDVVRKAVEVLKGSIAREPATEDDRRPPGE